MSDTPRADAAEIVLVYPAGSAYQTAREVQTASVPADFARQLEREVAALREAAERYVATQTEKINHGRASKELIELQRALKKNPQ